MVSTRREIMEKNLIACPLCNSTKGFKTMRQVPVTVEMSVEGDFEHYEEDMDLENFGPTYTCLKCHSDFTWYQLFRN